MQQAARDGFDTLDPATQTRIHLEINKFLNDHPELKAHP
jgi:hypothetical protein